MKQRRRTRRLRTRVRKEPHATVPTLRLYMDRLDRQDKALLVRLINEAAVLGSECHLGMLPFVTMGQAAMTMRVSGNTKAIRRLANKLETWNWVAGDDETSVVTFSIWAMDEQIIHQFGPHPELGVRLPGGYIPKIKVTAGLKWSLPKRDYVPDENVMVDPMIKLTPNLTLQNCWTVTCPTRFKHIVAGWFVDHNNFEQANQRLGVRA